MAAARLYPSLEYSNRSPGFDARGAASTLATSASLSIGSSSLPPRSPESPAVWVSSWWIVMSDLSGGTPGRYLAIGSETVSLPSISNFRIAAAVNCLVTEPMQDTMSMVYGWFVSRSASPYAFFRSTVPSFATSTAPEYPYGTSRDRYRSTRAPISPATTSLAGCATTGAPPRHSAAAGTTITQARMRITRSLLAALPAGGLNGVYQMRRGPRTAVAGVTRPLSLAAPLARSPPAPRSGGPADGGPGACPSPRARAGPPGSSNTTGRTAAPPGPSGR